MFENRKPISFIKASKDGKMTVSRGKDESGSPVVEKYDYVTGRISSIGYHESMYNGETIRSWRIRLVDSEQEALFTVSHSSGFTRGLINSLCAADLTKPVSISCYLKNDFLQPSVRQNGEIVKWKYQDMPKGEKITVGTKEVIDDSEVVKWLEARVNEINGAITLSDPVVDEPLPEPPPETDEDLINDLPF